MGNASSVADVSTSFRIECGVRLPATTTLCIKPDARFPLKDASQQRNRTKKGALAVVAEKGSKNRSKARSGRRHFARIAMDGSTHNSTEKGDHPSIFRFRRTLFKRTDKKDQPAASGLSRASTTRNTNPPIFGATKIDPPENPVGRPTTDQERIVEEHFLEALREHDPFKCRRFLAAGCRFLLVERGVTDRGLLYPEEFPLAVEALAFLASRIQDRNDYGIRWEYLAEIEPGKIYVPGFSAGGSCERTSAPGEVSTSASPSNTAVVIPDDPCNLYLTVSVEGKLVLWVQELPEPQTEESGSSEGGQPASNKS